MASNAPLYFPPKLTPEILARLRAEHGPRLVVWRQGKMTLAVRRATRDDYLTFKRHRADKETRAEAEETLARACLVHPSGADLDRLFDDWPYLDATIADHALATKGVEEGVVELDDTFRGDEA